MSLSEKSIRRDLFLRSLSSRAWSSADRYVFGEMFASRHERKRARIRMHPIHPRSIHVPQPVKSRPIKMGVA